MKTKTPGIFFPAGLPNPGFPSKAPNLCALSAKSARKVDIGSMPQKTRGTKKQYPKISGISLVSNVSKKVAWLDIITWAIDSRTWYTYYIWLYMYLFQRQMVTIVVFWLIAVLIIEQMGTFSLILKHMILRWFMRHIWGMSQRMLPSPFKMVHFSAKLMAFNAQVETHHDTLNIHIYTYNTIQLRTTPTFAGHLLQFRTEREFWMFKVHHPSGRACDSTVVIVLALLSGAKPWLLDVGQHPLCVQKDVHKLA